MKLLVYLQVGVIMYIINENPIYIITRGREEERAVRRMFPEVPWFPPCGWADPMIRFVFPQELFQKAKKFVEEWMREKSFMSSML